MKIRVEYGDALYHCRPWSHVFAKNQWNYIRHIIDAKPELWSKRLVKYNITLKSNIHEKILPFRIRDRSRIRWDNYVADSCRLTWLEFDHMHWPDILMVIVMYDYEDAFVNFVTGED